jgi:hypothetical protein
VAKFESPAFKSCHAGETAESLVGKRNAYQVANATLNPKGKGKEERKPTPNPSLKRRKGKETRKGKGKLQPLDIRARGCVFSFSRAGRGLAQSACPLTSWPPVAIPLKQIIEPAKVAALFSSVATRPSVTVDSRAYNP